MKNFKLLSTIFGLLFSISSGAQAEPYSSYDCEKFNTSWQIPEYSIREFRDLLLSGQTTDKILVSKEDRKLYLIKNGVIAKSYNVAYGLSASGHKQFEGDGKTPEGLYFIEHKNPKSSYYLSLKISYPNARDKAYAETLGKSAGGEIMVHGLPSNRQLSHNFVSLIHPMVDWTQGCIAVDDQDIFEIYTLTKVGTPIEICPRKKSAELYTP